jgi:hypothetical protein
VVVVVRMMRKSGSSFLPFQTADNNHRKGGGSPGPMLPRHVWDTLRTEQEAMARQAQRSTGAATTSPAARTRTSYNLDQDRSNPTTTQAPPPPSGTVLFPYSLWTAMRAGALIGRRAQEGGKRVGLW